MAGAAAYRADGVAQVINCYYLKNGDELAVAKTAEQFASGEVAYLLNSGGGTFYQNIDNGAEKDAFPVLDPSHGKVYLKNGVYTNGGEQKTTTTETTTETTTQTVTQDAGDGFVYGAAMAESKLTASDAAMILQKVLDGNVVMPIEKKTGDYLKYVDVDADKNLTASDAAMVLQKVLDEKYKFPAEK